MTTNLNFPRGFIGGVAAADAWAQSRAALAAAPAQMVGALAGDLAAEMSRVDALETALSILRVSFEQQREAWLAQPDTARVADLQWLDTCVRLIDAALEACK